MKIENGVVVLERKDCHWCQEGTRSKVKLKTCEKCHGTGKRGRGNCRNCNDKQGYYPRGRHPGQLEWYDHADREVCSLCHGNYKDFKAEDYTDYVDASTIPIVVSRVVRQQSFVEQHIGVGVYSIVDYGRHKSQTDEALIAQVHKEMHRVQACKIVRSKDNLQVCDRIAIVTAQSGFSAVAVFNQEGGG